MYVHGSGTENAIVDFKKNDSTVLLVVIEAANATREYSFGD